MSEIDPTEAMRRGIQAVRREDYLAALTLLGDAYGSSHDMPPPDGLSYLGLCVALVQKKIKPGVDLCKKAIEMQFYHGDHYANLARVYMVAEHRRKALDTIEKGLKVVPDDEQLTALKKELGNRKSPPIPFLPRGHALNVMIGRKRHARAVAEKEKVKEKEREAREKERARKPPPK